MTTLREAAQQALDALGGLLTFNTTKFEYSKGREAAKAIRAALALPQMDAAAIRDAAFEEAARLADKVGGRDRDFHAYDAAAAIRALKGQE